MLSSENISNYQLLAESEMRMLIDFDLLETFAQKHSGAYVNMAEFILNSRVVSFSYILNYAHASEKNNFISCGDYSAGIIIRSMKC